MTCCLNDACSTTYLLLSSCYQVIKRPVLLHIGIGWGCVLSRCSIPVRVVHDLPCKLHLSGMCTGLVSN